MPSDLEVFRKTRIYTAEKPAQEVVSDLEAMRALHGRSEAKSSFWKWSFWLLLLPAIAALVFCLPRLEESPLIVGVLFLVEGAWVFSFVTWSAWAMQSFDLPRVELLEATLDPISRDLPANGRVNVRLDFGSHEGSQKLQREGQANGWKVKYYVDPWCSLTGRLIDGSVFRLTVTNYTQKRGKWKKGASGKSKYKSKTKQETVFALRLRFKPGKYPAVETITAAEGAVQLPPGAACSKCRVTAREISLAASVNAWNASRPSTAPANSVSGTHTAVMLFLSAYQILHLSKTLGRAR